MHLHITICVSLISISRFTHFLRFSVCLQGDLLKQQLSCCFSSQVLCSAQVAPAEVFGHQESNQERSDRGGGKRSIHEGCQTQVRSCKLSSFIYFLSTFLSRSPYEVLSGFATFIPFSPFPFVPFILPFCLCMLDCHSPFSEVFAQWPSEKSLAFLLP